MHHVHRHFRFAIGIRATDFIQQLFGVPPLVLAHAEPLLALRGYFITRVTQEAAAFGANALAQPVGVVELERPLVGNIERLWDVDI